MAICYLRVLRWKRVIGSLLRCFIGSLIRCFIDSLIPWFIDSFSESLIHRFDPSSIHWIIDSLARWFIGSWVDWFIPSVVHGFFHALSLASQQPFAHLMMNVTTSTLRCFCISKTFLYAIFFLYDIVFFVRNFRPGACWALPGRPKNPKN